MYVQKIFAVPQNFCGALSSSAVLPEKRSRKGFDAVKIFFIKKNFSFRGKFMVLELLNSRIRRRAALAGGLMRFEPAQRRNKFFSYMFNFLMFIL